MPILVETYSTASIKLEYTIIYNDYNDAARKEQFDLANDFQVGISDLSYKDCISGSIQFDQDKKKIPHSTKFKTTSVFTVFVAKGAYESWLKILSFVEDFCAKHNFNDYRITVSGLGAHTYEE